MRVVVTGGTGFIGTYLCRELDNRGHDVVAVSRSPEGEGLPDGVETVVGDVTAYDSVAEHFEGADVAYNLVALSPLYKPKGGNERHFAVHLGGTENVVRAAEEHDLDRVVQQSGLGADPDGPTAFLRAKGQAEEAVRESDVESVITRPSVVFGDGGEFVSFTRMVTTPYVTLLPGGGRTRFQPIWVGDLAPMLADAAAEEHAGQTYELAGPEVLTLADVARLASRAEGRPLTVLNMPMGLARLGMSAMDPIPFLPFGTDQYRSLQFDNTVEHNDVDAFGVSEEDLTTLAAYLGVDERDAAELGIGARRA